MPACTPYCAFAADREFAEPENGQQMNKKYRRGREPARGRLSATGSMGRPNNGTNHIGRQVCPAGERLLWGKHAAAAAPPGTAVASGMGGRGKARPCPLVPPCGSHRRPTPWRRRAGCGTTAAGWLTRGASSARHLSVLVQAHRQGAALQLGACGRDSRAAPHISTPQTAGTAGR